MNNLKITYEQKPILTIYDNSEKAWDEFAIGEEVIIRTKNRTHIEGVIEKIKKNSIIIYDFECEDYVFTKIKFSDIIGFERY